MFKNLNHSLFYLLLTVYCFIFAYSIYSFEPEPRTSKPIIIELTQEQKLNKKIKDAEIIIKEAESRIKEAEAAEAKLKVEQQKNEKLKNQAIAEQDTAKKLFTEEKEKRFKKTITFITELLIVVLFLTLSFIIYKIHTWRKKANNNSIELPEIVREDIDKISKKISLLNTAEGEQLIRDEIIESVNKIKKSFPESINYLSGFIESLEQKADKNYTEGIKLLQEQLKLKEDKISEIQELKLRKIYIKEIIKLSTMVKYFLKEKKDSKELKNIDESIDFLLKNEDLKELSFGEGVPCEELISKEHKVRDDIITDQEMKDGTVCETLEKGFYIESHEGKKIIVKEAEISIYKFSSEDKNLNNSIDSEIKDTKK